MGGLSARETARPSAEMARAPPETAAAVRALVTGGGGFLGSAVVRALLARGDAVRSLSRGEYPGLRALGAETMRGDVADRATVRAAAAGCDVVFHVAAKAGISGPRSAYVRTNVEGTRAVIEACRAHGISRLVHTSTPSVVHTGVDIHGGDETMPYAERFDSPYPRTKAVAERIVLAANGPSLATVALRPHLIWGPGDTQLVPRILERARAGRLRFVGDGSALVDSTYVDNAADAHLGAADRLGPDAPCAGRAYFISQGEPMPVRELANAILATAGLAPVTKTIPFPAAYALGAGAEVVYRLLRSEQDPPMTRFLARQLASAHWFDISAARRDLGYAPRVSIEAGLAALGRHIAAVPA